MKIFNMQDSPYEKERGFINIPDLGMIPISRIIDIISH